MNTTEILSALDSEIAHLTKVRDLLSSLGDSPQGRGRLSASMERQALSAAAEIAPKRGRGRPKGSTTKGTATASAPRSGKLGGMSAEGASGSLPLSALAGQSRTEQRRPPSRQRKREPAQSRPQPLQRPPTARRLPGNQRPPRHRAKWVGQRSLRHLRQPPGPPALPRVSR